MKFRYRLVLLISTMFTLMFLSLTSFFSTDVILINYDEGESIRAAVGELLQTSSPQALDWKQEEEHAMDEVHIIEEPSTLTRLPLDVDVEDNDNIKRKTLAAQKLNVIVKPLNWTTKRAVKDRNQKTVIKVEASDKDKQNKTQHELPDSMLTALKVAMAMTSYTSGADQRKIEYLRSYVARLEAELTRCGHGETTTGEAVQIIQQDLKNYHVQINQLKTVVERLPPPVTKKELIDPPKYLHLYNGKDSYNGEENSTEQNDQPTWHRLVNNITQYGLYDSTDQATLDQVLNDLGTLPLKHIDDISDEGTQLKHIYWLGPRNNTNVARAIFKPMSILGFRSVPPVVGRKIDVVTEMFDLASRELQKTFYISPIGNTCYYGKCRYFCDAGHGICANGSILEGSLALLLPSSSEEDFRLVENPWQRSYSRYMLHRWQESGVNGTAYCQSVRSRPPYDRDTPLLHIIDAHILDFLTGNIDRHHMHQFEQFDKDSFLILFDNGKGFGRPNYDEISLLAPLHHCCRIRRSTLTTLLDLDGGRQHIVIGDQDATNTKVSQAALSTTTMIASGGRLSERMRRSLLSDSLENILTEVHLRALDRRVKVILSYVNKCIVDNKNNVAEVVIDDGWR